MAPLWPLTFSSGERPRALLFFLSGDLLMHPLRTIWTILVWGHQGTIPVEFDQILISGSREEVVMGLFTFKNVIILNSFRYKRDSSLCHSISSEVTFVSSLFQNISIHGTVRAPTIIPWTIYTFDHNFYGFNLIRPHIWRETSVPSYFESILNGKVWTNTILNWPLTLKFDLSSMQSNFTIHLFMVRLRLDNHFSLEKIKYIKNKDTNQNKLLIIYF